MKATKFKFHVMPEFEIDTAIAARILSDPDPQYALLEWFHTENPTPQFNIAICEVQWLRTALQECLCEMAIQEAKQLTMPV